MEESKIKLFPLLIRNILRVPVRYQEFFIEIARRKLHFFIEVDPSKRRKFRQEGNRQTVEKYRPLMEEKIKGKG
jgi:hypothetical protein